MHSAAGFRGLLAVAMAVIEMTVMMSMVGGAPVSLDRDVSEGGDRKTLHSTHSNAERQGNTVPTNNSPERRAKFLKILSDLGELQRSISSSMGGRVTAVLRGNKANSRGSGKKNKVAVSEGTQKVPTLPPVDGGGTVSGPSERPPEQKNRGGKDFKKSQPQSPKKPNKRVCFWKYCSQN